MGASLGFFVVCMHAFKKTLPLLNFGSALVCCVHACIQEEPQASKERKGAARPESAPQPDGRVEELLQGCGLDEWGQCFARERIEYAAMLELEMSDLVSLGMPLGHRKLLLKAVRLASSASDQAPPVGLTSSVGLTSAVGLTSSSSDQAAPSHSLEPPAPPSPPAQEEKKKKKAARRVPGAAGTEQGGQARQAHAAEADNALLHTPPGPPPPHTARDAHGWVTGGQGGAGGEAPHGETPEEVRTSRASLEDGGGCGAGLERVGAVGRAAGAVAAGETHAQVAGETHSHVAGRQRRGGAEAQRTAEEEERTTEEEECTSVEPAAVVTRVGVRKGKMSLQEKRVAKTAAQAAKKAAKLATRDPASDNAETAHGQQQKALDAFSVRQVSSNPN